MSRLDINEIKEGVIKSIQETESARGQNLVLVLGQTGAGKSTTVNYLIHHPLKKVRGGKVQEMDPSFPAPAKMGDSAESVTAYPASYAYESFVYADCPGFKDTGSDEKRVVVSVGTEALVNKANRIDAVMAVVEWGSIDGPKRGEGLRDVALTLGSLFDERKATGTIKSKPFDLQQSMIFVVTKVRFKTSEVDVEGVDHEYCMEKVDDLLNVSKKQLAREEARMKEILETAKHNTGGDKKASTDKAGKGSAPSSARDRVEEDQQWEKVEGLSRQVSILTIMKNNPKNIILVNVVDKGETRGQIVSRLKEMKPIPKGIMNFNAADSARGYFCSQVTREMVEAKGLIDLVLRTPDEIKQIQQSQVALREELKQYQQEKEKIQCGQIFLGPLDPVVVRSRNTIEENKRTIVQSREDIKELEKIKLEKFQEVSGLDLKEDVVFYSESFKLSRKRALAESVTSWASDAELASCATIRKADGVLPEEEPEPSFLSLVAGATKDIVLGTVGSIASKATSKDKDIAEPKDESKEGPKSTSDGSSSKWTKGDIAVAVTAPLWVPVAAAGSAVVIGAGIGLSPISALAGAVRRIEYNFKYTGAPFNRVEENLGNGEIVRNTYEPVNGKYDSLYESDRGSEGKAIIVVWGEKRNKPDIKTKIEELYRELAALTEKIKDKNAEIETLSETNSKLNRLADEFLNQDRSNQERRLFEVGEMLKDVEQRLAKAEQSLTAKQEKLAICQADIAKRLPYWKVIQELSAFIKFNDISFPNIVDQFSERLCRVPRVVSSPASAEFKQAATAQLLPVLPRASSNPFVLAPMPTTRTADALTQPVSSTTVALTQGIDS